MHSSNEKFQKIKLNSISKETTENFIYQIISRSIMDCHSSKRPQDYNESTTSLLNNSKRQRSSEVENTFHLQSHFDLSADDEVVLDSSKNISNDERGITDTNSTSPHNNQHHNNTNTNIKHEEDHESQESSTFAHAIREERKETTNAAAEKLELILEDVKHTTQKLLHEIDCYLKAVENVTVDFMKCQESQAQNATRLDDVETDVAGATARFTSAVAAGVLR